MQEEIISTDADVAETANMDATTKALYQFNKLLKECIQAHNEFYKKIMEENIENDKQLYPNGHKEIDEKLKDLQDFKISYSHLRYCCEISELKILKDISELIFTNKPDLINNNSSKATVYLAVLYYYYYSLVFENELYELCPVSVLLKTAEKKLRKSDIIIDVISINRLISEITTSDETWASEARRKIMGMHGGKMRRHCLARRSRRSRRARKCKKSRKRRNNKSQNSKSRNSK
jgi:hypothetical protein